jgi:hypothetical protein
VAANEWYCGTAAPPEIKRERKILYIFAKMIPRKIGFQFTSIVVDRTNFKTFETRALREDISQYSIGTAISLPPAWVGL